MAYVPLGDQMARKTTDIGSIFESPIDDLKLQVTTSVDGNLSEQAKRISKIEHRLDELSREACVARTINSGGTVNANQGPKLNKPKRPHIGLHSREAHAWPHPKKPLDKPPYRPHPPVLAP